MAKALGPDWEASVGKVSSRVNHMNHVTSVERISHPAAGREYMASHRFAEGWEGLEHGWGPTPAAALADMRQSVLNRITALAERVAGIPS
jgi:hypothetical protein